MEYNKKCISCRFLKLTYPTFNKENNKYALHHARRSTVVALTSNNPYVHVCIYVLICVLMVGFGVFIHLNRKVVVIQFILNVCVLVIDLSTLLAGVQEVIEQRTSSSGEIP